MELRFEEGGFCQRVTFEQKESWGCQKETKIVDFITLVRDMKNNQKLVLFVNDAMFRKESS